MRLIATALLLLVVARANAEDLLLSLREVKSQATTNFLLNLETGKANVVSGGTGDPLMSSDVYIVRDWKLVPAVDGKALIDASQILFQTKVEDLDVLIIRDEYNSFSNPFRWLSALAGHPVQVSKILWITIKNGNVIYSVELRREPSSYEWTAGLFAKAKPSPITP